LSDSVLFYIQVLGGAVALAGYAYAKWRHPRRRVRRALDRLPETPIGQVKDGTEVRITGKVVVHGEMTASLVSKRPCIGYRLVIEARARSNQAMEAVVVREDCRSFYVEDGSGRALIEGPLVIGLDDDDAAWTDLPPAIFDILEAAKVSLTGSFGGDRSFRFTEALLVAGDEISVSGRATVAPDPAGAPRGHRHPPMLCRIVGSKAFPVMIADEEPPS
jgi:hypothetical protein